MLQDLLSEAVPKRIYSFPLTAHLARSLIEAGHEVVIHALAVGLREPCTLHGDRLRVHVGQLRERPMDRGRDFFRSERRWLQQSIASDPGDVIHAHWTYEFALAALRTSIPSIVTVHDWAPRVLMHQRDRYRALRLLMQWRVFLARPHLTAVSPYIQERIYHLTRRRVPLVPNGLSLDAYKPRPPRAGARGFVIGSINHGFLLRKNVGSLLRAFHRVRVSLPTARLVLAGREFGPGEVAERWSSSRGLDQGVTFVGELNAEAVPLFLRDLDLLVHPSLEESFGMSVLEAMATGVPVIAGVDSGALSWLLDGGGAGVLVDITSAEDIATAAVDVLSSDEKWSRFSDAGRSRASSHFSLDIVRDQYLVQYQRAIAQRAG